MKMPFAEDGRAQHTLAANPREVRWALLEKGFEHRARNPLATLIVAQNNLFEGWKHAGLRSEPTNKLWECPWCHNWQDLVWDVCRECAATIPEEPHTRSAS